MKTVAPLVLVSLLAQLSCTIDPAVLGGRACLPDGRCLADYTCDISTFTCVSSGDDCATDRMVTPCTMDAITCVLGCRTCLGGAWSNCVASDLRCGPDSFDCPGGGFAPVATEPAQVTVVEDSSSSPITLTGTDTEDPEDNLWVRVLAAPRHGLLDVQEGTAPILVIYTPAPDYVGADGFSFTVQDTAGNVSSPAPVALTVLPQPDWPVAVDDTVTTSVGHSVTVNVLANDYDVDGDPLSIVSVGGSAHGYTNHNGALVVYTPVPDYIGTDGFSYTIEDSTGRRATAVVDVTVNTVPPPTAIGPAQVSADEDIVSAPFTLDGTDPAGLATTLMVAVTSLPRHGVLSTTAGPAPLSLTYMPSPGYVGGDSLTFLVSADDGRSSDPLLVPITISSVNSPPSITPIADQVLHGSQVLTALPFFADEGGDTDEDYQVLTVVGVTSSNQDVVPDSNISVSFLDLGDGGQGALDIAPAGGQLGSTVITVAISDGHATAVEIFGVQVLPSSPPVAFDLGAATGLNTPVGITLRAHDPSAHEPIIGYTVESPPLDGMLSGTPPTLVYTPDTSFTGHDSFTYTATDGETSNIATVAIVVAGNLVFVVHDDALLAGSDIVVADRLSAQGFTVNLLHEDEASDRDVSGMDLVVVSASVTSTAINTAFLDTPVPVLTWERFLYDDMNMIQAQAPAYTGTALVDRIDIVFPEHPLAGGLAAGPHQVYDAATELYWGYPAAAADVVATTPNGEPVLFVYEAGDLMFNGFTAPARRVSYFLPSITTATLTADGLALLDAAVCTALAP